MLSIEIEYSCHGSCLLSATGVTAIRSACTSTPAATQVISLTFADEADLSFYPPLPLTTAAAAQPTTTIAAHTTTAQPTTTTTITAAIPTLTLNSL